MKHIRICIAIAAVATALIVTTPAFAASSVEQAQTQLAGGDLQGAMRTLDDYLASEPKDAEARFTRGLVLVKLNKTEDAIKVFSDLTRDYPQLPEPYNSLAVLHAQQGNYEKARDALEAALVTHPTYATANENLGDIYAALADAAYNRAATLDTSNQAVRHKQGLISPLDTGTGATAGYGTAHAVAPAPKPAAAARNSQTTSAADEPATTLAPADAAKVNEALLAWAKAWSARDVTGYLAQYSPDFMPACGHSHQAWAQQRSDRISHTKRIAVRVLNPETVKLSDGAVRVSFVQEYQSDAFSDQVNKVLKFKASSSGWKIVSEYIR